MAKCLGIYTEILKTLSPEIHNILNSVFIAILDQPLQNENGTQSFGYLILRELWLKCLETLITEDDARIYEQSVSRLYTVATNEADEVLGLFGWWSMFWHTVGIRYPQVAVDQVETFLNEFFDRNQMTFLHLLQVRFSILKSCEPSVAGRKYIDYDIFHEKTHVNYDLNKTSDSTKNTS